MEATVASWSGLPARDDPGRLVDRVRRRAADVIAGRVPLRVTWILPSVAIATRRSAATAQRSARRGSRRRYELARAIDAGGSAVYVRCVERRDRRPLGDDARARRGLRRRGDKADAKPECNSEAEAPASSTGRWAGTTRASRTASASPARGVPVHRTVARSPVRVGVVTRTSGTRLKRGARSHASVVGVRRERFRCRGHRWRRSRIFAEYPYAGEGERDVARSRGGGPRGPSLSGVVRTAHARARPRCRRSADRIAAMVRRVARPTAQHHQHRGSGVPPSARRTMRWISRLRADRQPATRHLPWSRLPHELVGSPAWDGLGRALVGAVAVERADVLGVAPGGASRAA